MPELSDMDYLRSKVASAHDRVEVSKEKDDDDEDDDAEEDGGTAQHPDSAYESGENSSKAKSSKNKTHSKDKKSAQQEVTVGRGQSHRRFHQVQTDSLTPGFFFGADGADDGLHGEAERSAVQRQRGEDAALRPERGSAFVCLGFEIESLSFL